MRTESENQTIIYWIIKTVAEMLMYIIIYYNIKDTERI